MYRAVLAAALAWVLLSCGAGVPARSGLATPVGMTNAQYLGPITTAVDYHGTHLRPPTAIASVPWTTALNSCNPFCGLAQRQAPVVELVSYSDDQYVANVASSSRPTYQSVLAYAVIWRGIPCLIAGPGGSQPDPNMKCDAFYFVDATTGERLPAYEDKQPS